MGELLGPRAILNYGDRMGASRRVQAQAESQSEGSSLKINEKGEENKRVSRVTSSYSTRPFVKEQRSLRRKRPLQRKKPLQRTKSFVKKKGFLSMRITNC